jgi:AraC-like DNA-binding protein
VTIPIVSGFSLGPTQDVLERLGGWSLVEKSFSSSGLPLLLIEDRRAFIPYEAQGGLMEYASRRSGDEYLGFHVGQAFPFHMLGTFGRYVTQARSLDHALRRAAMGIRYYANKSEIGIQVEGDLIGITYSSAIQGLPGSRHITDGVISILWDLLASYGGPRWKPDRIEVDYPRSHHAGFLEEHLQVPIKFDRDRVAMFFPLSLLGAESTRSVPLIKRLDRADLRSMIRSPPPRDFIGVVREVVRMRLMEGWADLDGTARFLNLGPRTVQRRLRIEGRTYQSVLDQVRLERAAALLGEQQEPTIEIAMALGYASHSQFFRAFKRWTGMTPTDFRRPVRTQRDLS